MIYKMLKVFAARSKNRKEYRFHINTLEDFKACMAADFIKESMIEYVTRPIPSYPHFDLPIRDGWVPDPKRDQPEAIAYAKKDVHKASKVLTLKPGGGKSYCSMQIVHDLGYRPAYVLRPGYIDKWVRDAVKTLDIEPEDVMTVEGSKQLKALLELASLDALDAKVILISNKTIQNWLKLYEHEGAKILDLGYACLPEDLFEHIKSCRVVDELHQDFHLNFKIDLYTHTPYSISLSGTLKSDDDFVNKMYEVAYPGSMRFVPLTVHKFIRATAIMYHLKHPDRIRTTQPGDTRYSHVAFEQSIMKNKEALKGYVDLIIKCVDGMFMGEYIRGDRMVIYASTVEFCTYLTNQLRSYYYEFNIGRYVQGDPYSNLMTMDISVTTLGSAGTNVDIPGLKRVLLTVALNSSQGNIQGAGRLRELNDGRTPDFAYLVCEDVPKAIDYHRHKLELLKDEALKCNIERSGMRI
jgi:hypothetical protein